MERKVGEIFEYNGVVLKVEEQTPETKHPCDGCFLSNNVDSCIKQTLVDCQGIYRYDNKDVIFKLVE